MFKKIRDWYNYRKAILTFTKHLKESGDLQSKSTIFISERFYKDTLDMNLGMYDIIHVTYVDGFVKEFDGLDWGIFGIKVLKNCILKKITIKREKKDLIFD